MVDAQSLTDSFSQESGNLYSAYVLALRCVGACLGDENMRTLCELDIVCALSAKNLMSPLCAAMSTENDVSIVPSGTRGYTFAKACESVIISDGAELRVESVSWSFSGTVHTGMAFRSRSSRMVCT